MNEQLVPHTIEGALLTEFLRLSTVERVDLRHCGAVIDSIATRLGRRAPRASRQQVAAAVLFEAAVRPGVEYVSRGVRWQPLVAAKYLLGLVEYNLDNPDQIVHGTSLTLREVRRRFDEEKGSTPKHQNFNPNSAIGLRGIIASEASGLGGSRFNFGPKSERLREVAESLWVESQELMRSDNVTRLLEARLEALSLAQRRAMRDRSRQWGRIEPADASQIGDAHDGAEPPQQRATRSPLDPSESMNRSRQSRSSSKVTRTVPRLRWRTRRRLFVAALAVLVLAAVGTSGYFVWQSQVLPPVTATKTSVIRPDTLSKAPKSQLVKGAGLTCSLTSDVSMRKDAHMCSGGGDYPLFDPCFDVSKNVVSCPQASGAGGTAGVDAADWPVKKFTQFFFDKANESKTVSSDAALDQYYPWAIFLNEKISGNLVVCVVSYQSPGADLPVSYVCPRGPVQLVPDLQGLIDGSKASILNFQPKGSFTGFDLDRSHKVWTLRVPSSTSPDEYNVVQVVQAYF